MKVSILPISRVVHVRDEAHAMQLLRAAEPLLSKAELQALAKRIVEGRTLLVRGDEYELLDPAPSHREPPIPPWAPDEPSPPQPGPDVATTWFHAQLVDAHGVPLSGVDVTWLYDGERPSKTTGADGIVRLEEVPARSASLWIPSTPSLREALAQAWARPSTDAPLQADDGIEVLHYRDAPLGPVRFSPEHPHTISIQPFVVMGRLVGMLFDTDRDFLLPISLPAIAELRDLYDRCEAKSVLVVGHTDTTAQPEYNEGLSRVRAESVRAYLTDDVDAWLARYEDVVGRWGTTEDLYMLSALPDWPSRPPGRDPVTWFQETRGLWIDGRAGEQTRSALIGEYMGRDVTTLPPGTTVEVHGCGEAFPLDATGFELDEAPTDGAGDPIDRRVEVFFFGDSLGVQPPAPGPTSGADSTAYLSWRHRAQTGYEEVFGAQALEIVLQDENGVPIPSERYTVRLAVGTTIDGQLGTDGRARIERLPAGIVTVDFPDLARGAVVSRDSELKGPIG